MKSLSVVAVTAALCLTSTGSILAQSRISTDRTEVLRTLTSIQMVESLQSDLPMVRSQTLKNAIVYSSLYPQRIDLNAAVTMIARVAADDATMANRRLAVAALRSIDSYRANRYLAELEGMQDEEFQTLVAGVLAEYREGPDLGRL